MGAPMPESIRHGLRAKQHPARAVQCPHCLAAPFRPCRVPVRSVVMAQPHPARVAAWTTAVACCPACQVEPGAPCHDAGRPLHDGAVHPQREREAKVTAA